MDDIREMVRQTGAVPCPADRSRATVPLPPAPPMERPVTDSVQTECDYCGSSALEWRKCKLICTDCRQINKSCADL
jgi:hypothetical protein